MRLGEILIAKKLITEAQLNVALIDQQLSKEFLGSILVRRKFIAEDELLKALAEQFQIPYVRLKDQYIDWNVAMRFSSSLVVDHACLPIHQDEKGITVAITNPLDAGIVSKAEAEAKGDRIRLILVAPQEMNEAIKSYRQHMKTKIKKLLE